MSIKPILIIASLLILCSCNTSKNDTNAISTQTAAETAPSSDPKTEITGNILYANDDYGFSVNLPESWENYSIQAESWEGTSSDSNGNSQISETGPLISVRHPDWAEDKKRQDIPIMIFTIDQWERLNNDEFHIGAASVNPSELARNSKYVFALPARYNFAYPEGFEEVQQIIDSGAVNSK